MGHLHARITYKNQYYTDGIRTVIRVIARLNGISLFDELFNIDESNNLKICIWNEFVYNSFEICFRQVAQLELSYCRYIIVIVLGAEFLHQKDSYEIHFKPNDMLEYISIKQFPIVSLNQPMMNTWNARIVTLAANENLIRTRTTGMNTSTQNAYTVNTLFKFRQEMENHFLRQN